MNQSSWLHTILRTPRALLLLCLCVLLQLPYLQAITPKQCRLVPAHKVSVTDAGASQGASQPRPSGNPDQNANNSTADSGNTTKDGDIDWKPFEYGRTPIRGVNLGGWFVLEPWITPSFFQKTGNDDIVNEYTLGQKLPPDQALEMLTAHWESWIVEEDFKEMSEAGLNHVRIPLGYWSVPLTQGDTDFTTSVKPYIPGAWPYFLKALNWARSHGLHVLVDIHGAPGSQNGYDNSGRRTSNPQWALDPENISRTLDVIKFIVKNTGGMIDMIELLNEGAGFLSGAWPGALRKFFGDGYQLVRDTVGDDMKVMIGDAFMTVNNWQDFLTYPDAQGVFMDMHEYQIFSNQELSRSFDDHLNFACSWIPTLSSYASSNLWTVIGEWSTVVTDCAKWLNGRNVGARWDGTYPGGAPALGSCKDFTGSWKDWDDDYKVFLRQYWESQVEIGESIQGWIFWTWKAEQADEWSYQAGLEGGWIPKDPSGRKYPQICK